jgi:hypothetical protein
MLITQTFDERVTNGNTASNYYLVGVTGVQCCHWRRHIEISVSQWHYLPSDFGLCDLWGTPYMHFLYSSSELRVLPILTSLIRYPGNTTRCTWIENVPNLSLTFTLLLNILSVYVLNCVNGRLPMRYLPLLPNNLFFNTWTFLIINFIFLFV